MNCPNKLSIYQCPNCYWRDHKEECAYGRTCQFCGHIHEPDDAVMNLPWGTGAPGCGSPMRMRCVDEAKCKERYDAQFVSTVVSREVIVEGKSRGILTHRRGFQFFGDLFKGSAE